MYRSCRIVTTIDHPFYVKNYSFIDASELQIGKEVVSSTGDTYLVENGSYNAWPLSNLSDDKIAESLTDEADDNWFVKYKMQHIVPDLNYVKIYLNYCNSINLQVKVLLFESLDNTIVIEDELKIYEELGFDCIGSVYHSYLQTEFNDFKAELLKKNITLNKYGLLDKFEDALFFIELRKKAIISGINLEDFWEELPVRISVINIL